VIRSTQILASLLFFVLAVLPGCGRAGGEAEDDPVEGLASVRAVVAERMTLHPSISLVGTLAPVPERTVVLSTQVEGQIQYLCVEEGQSVHGGDDLVVLDDRTVQAALKKAKAALAEARSALALLRDGAHPRAIEAARQDLLKASAAARSLRQKVEALAPLHESHEVSDVRYEQANAERLAAEAEKEAASARLKLLEAGARPEEIAEAEAKVASAEADVQAQELAVNLCTIKSPIDGVVTQLPVRQGMYVAPPTTLATIVDLSSLFAQIRIPASYLSQVHPHAEAAIEVSSLPGGQLTGAIARVGKEADALTGDVTAFVSVPNPDRDLRAGLACRVCLALPDIPEAVAVPAKALSDRGGVPVLTVIRDGKAYEIEVQLGGQTSDFVQITEGVSEGELVVVEGGYGLPEGCPVSVTAGDERFLPAVRLHASR